MDQVISALAFITLYGVSYGVVLFAVSVGLVVTMGLMRVVNLAHTAFAAFGGYIAVSMLREFDVPFALAVVCAVLGVALFSLVIEKLYFVTLYTAGELDQVLMTTGLLFLAVASLNLIFGPNAYTTHLPPSLSGTVSVGGMAFSVYRIVVIGIGILLVVALHYLFERTNFGAQLRAAVDNRTMAQASGIDVARLFTAAFTIGNGLAAFGGAIGFVILPLEPMYPFKYLALVLVVVTLANFGNIRASAAVSVLVGVIDTAGRYLFPKYGTFTIYLLLIGVLVWRGRAAFGRVTS